VALFDQASAELEGPKKCRSPLESEI